jgi:hypothetical protein
MRKLNALCRKKWGNYLPFVKRNEEITITLSKEKKKSPALCQKKWGNYMQFVERNEEITITLSIEMRKSPALCQKKWGNYLHSAERNEEITCTLSKEMRNHLWLNFHSSWTPSHYKTGSVTFFKRKVELWTACSWSQKNYPYTIFS